LALVDRANQLEKKVRELEEAAAQTRAEALLREAGILDGKGCTGENGTGRIYAFCVPGADMADVMRIGRAAQKLSQTILILGSEVESKFAAFCSGKGADLRSLLKGRLEAAGGRGGGGPSFFQGAFDSSGKLKAFLADIPRNIRNAAL
jgi:alanyl-tRNA synthetase